MNKVLWCMYFAAGVLGAFEVVIDRDAPAAVRDFQYHMRKMTGRDASIRIAPHEYKVRLSSPTREAFRLRGDGARAFISGESATAVSHGLYELLERLGCDWVMPGTLGEVIPRNPSPALVACDIEEAPSFDVRAPWYSGGRGAHTAQELADYNLWKLRHKMQLERDANPLVMRGGHVWSELIRRYRAEFEKHPEMYALVRQPDGSMKRQGPQVETTDPRVLKLFEQYIREEFAKNKWPRDKAVCIGVGPSDGSGFSESAESRAAGSGRLDPTLGVADGTDLMVLLCNTLLERLEKDFPNLHLGFYLYSWHAGYPVRYKVHPKIVIVIADISYSRFHSTLEPVPTRIYYRSLMEKWAKTPNVKFFRGYNWNLAENFLPYSKLKMWADDLPMYHRMNVRGAYNESDMCWATLAPSNYLEAKLLWNVKTDPEQVLERFSRAVAGAGGEALASYYRQLTRRQSEARQEAGSFHSFGLMYDGKFVRDSQKLFARAEQLAKTPEEKDRVRVLRFPLDQLGIFVSMRKAFNVFDFQTAKKLFDQTLSARNKMRLEGRGFVGRGATKMLERFFQKPLEAAVRYSSAPYRIVFKLPDAMKTLFDPMNCGAELGYAEPAVDDGKALMTNTFSTTWAARKLDGLRSGSVWYRVKMPALRGPAGLLICGADNVVRVYCNGHLVGEGRGFARPLTFDLTDSLRPGGENLLAIQVERDGNSEIGTGGLIYPAFVFTGPRLSEKAPESPQYRLLPGGAVEKISR